eukprot:m.126492 g.126492  ORF g.126492 m.126492 type:complete len:599 (-) comp52238_c0_seq7:364-2160(-)
MPDEHNIPLGYHSCSVRVKPHSDTRCALEPTFATSCPCAGGARHMDEALWAFLTASDTASAAETLSQAQLDTALQVALRGGHIEAMQTLQAQGAQFDLRQRDQCLLHDVAERGPVEVFEYLFSLKLWDLSACDKIRGTTVLHLAAAHGHTELVERLLRDTYFKNIVNQHETKSGETPLMKAVGSGHTAISLALLPFSLGTRPRNLKTGDTVLHIASEKQRDEVLAQFLRTEYIADLNVQNKDGLTPTACAVRSKSILCVQQLIASNADFSIKDNEGRLPIHRAIADEHMLRLFTENRCCDLNLQDNEGRTALVLAVQAKNVQAVRQLFNAGADPAIPDKEKKWNACHWAARLDEELVLALLPAARGRPACLDAPDNKGNTPLLLAAEWGFAANVRLLAQAGANLHARNQLGRTAIHIASACAGSAALAAVLSQSTADLNVQDNDRSTALMIAVQNLSQSEHVQLLLDAQADVSLTNKKGRTALHMDAIKDCRLLPRLMHAATRGTINLQDEDGNTALMLLLVSPSFVFLNHEGQVDVIRQVLASGADASLANKVRETALILAQRRKWTHLIAMLPADAPSRARAKGTVRTHRTAKLRK